MNKFIIFISISLLFTPSMNTLTSKLKEKMFKPKDCLPRIIETYVSSNAPSQSIQSDEIMLELCPDLHESCCLKNNLNDLHALVLKGIKGLQTFQNQFEYVVLTIQQASEPTVNQFIQQFIAKEKGSQELNFEDEEEEEQESKNLIALREAFEYIKNNHKIILEDLNSAVEMVISTNSRFGCAVCNRENLFSFKNMHSKNPVLKLDMNQCNSIFSDERVMSIFNLDHHTMFLYEIIKSLAFVENGSSPHEKFLSEKELSNLPKLMELCKQEANFITKMECQSLCKGMKFLNGNPFYEIQRQMIAGRVIIDFYLKGGKKKTETELNIEYEALKNEIVKPFFVMPHLPSPFLIENFETDFTWNDGWNIMNFEMNYNSFVKNVENKNLEEFILKAPRTAEELFQITTRSIQFVEDEESESTKIVGFFITAILFFMFSN